MGFGVLPPPEIQGQCKEDAAEDTGRVGQGQLHPKDESFSCVGDENVAARVRGRDRGRPRERVLKTLVADS